jgi:hypothetical protein
VWSDYKSDKYRLRLPQKFRQILNIQNPPRAIPRGFCFMVSSYAE